MHRRIIITLIITAALLLTSCSKAKPDINTESGTGAYCSDFVNGIVTGSPEGYYFFDTSEVSMTTLWFFDRESKKIVPLCGKAECSHNGGNCDASFPIELFSTYWIQYGEGYLYRIGRSGTDAGQWALYQISKDGSEREELFKICTAVSPDSELDALDFPFFAVHDGYCYYAHSDTSKNPAFTCEFARVKLEKNAKPELLWQEEGYGNHITALKVLDGKIFFSCSSYEDSDYTGRNYRLMSCDVSDGSVSCVLDMDSDGYALLGNDVIVCYRNGSIVAYNCGTKEETKITDKLYGPIHFDGTYLYLDEFAGLFASGESASSDSRFIEVYDLDYQLVDKLSVSDAGITGAGIFYGGDSDYLFLGGAPSKAFDKSQIGTGTHEWIPMSVR